MTTDAGNNNRLIFFVALTVALVTAAVYLPALGNGFVNFDDDRYVYKNARITVLDSGFVTWAFTTFEFSNYHPLTWISYAVDYRIWGYNPFGYHLTSVVFHAINTFLVVVLAAGICLRKPSPPLSGQEVLVIAGATGLLFGIHPLHVESVAWVSGRKDVLFAFFFFLSLLAYLDYAEAKNHRRRMSYSLSLVLFLLSLLSKPMAVTLPAVLLLLDIYPLRRFSPGSVQSYRKVLPEKIPFIILSIASSLVTVNAQYSGESLIPLAAFSLSDRMITAVRAIGFYLFTFLVPSDLAPFYPVLPPVTFTLKDAVTIALLSGITIFGIFLWRRSNVWLIAWAYFVITLSPVLGILQIGSQAAADRYTYIPMMGPMLLAGIAAAKAVSKIKGKAYQIKYPFVFITLFSSGLLIGLSLLTAAQIKIWKDPLSLWNRELEIYPQNVSMVYRGRAEAYYGRGDYVKAREDYTRAILTEPGDYQAYSARGIISFITGQYSEAIADFEKALSIEPRYEEAIYYRGLAYRKVYGGRE